MFVFIKNYIIFAVISQTAAMVKKNMANLMASAETDNCIDQLNALIEQYDRTVSRMRAGGSGNEKLPKKDNNEESEI